MSHLIFVPAAAAAASHNFLSFPSWMFVLDGKLSRIDSLVIKATCHVSEDY